MTTTSNTHSTLFRGMAIMQEVAASQRGLSVVELMEVVGLPKPTVHRIAVQLETEGYLQRNPVDKRFTIGALLKDFSLSILSNVAVGAPRHAILEALSAEIGETCNCTMLDGNHIVYFDRVECNWPVKINLHPGSHLPLHATASGKLFLAHMKPRDRKRLLNAAPLSANTRQTLTDPELLEKDLKKMKEEGVAFDNEELFDGMVAVAVPVFDRSGRICFTVAVHAPTTRQQLADLQQYIPSLRKAADALAASYCSESDTA
uniref:HTH-type transcriptional repressor AllR n=1 Tax=uncultured Thiotrichaceae bacterium TaxID=298394 RepID=A0A6S6SJC1_9GAMM|nr:MAG: Transcriptional regulator, IclR family [uncultured Thiotrichaceae bacterium]